MKRALAVVAVCTALAGVASAQEATYTYDPGTNTFNVVNGTQYTTSMTVSGLFRTNPPLMPNMMTTDIRGAVTSYSFTDGVQTLTETNSYIGRFRISTGPDGRPSAWQITILRDGGGVVDGIDLLHNPSTGSHSLQIAGFLGAPCLIGTPSACDLPDFPNASDSGLLTIASANPIPDAGSWSVSVATVSSIPTASGWGLLVMAGLLSLVGVLALRISA